MLVASFPGKAREESAKPYASWICKNRVLETDLCKAEAIGRQKLCPAVGIFADGRCAVQALIVL